MDFKKKYFKYKSKYLNILKFSGGAQFLKRIEEYPYPSSPSTASSPPDTPKLVVDERDKSPLRNKKSDSYERDRDRSPPRRKEKEKEEEEVKVETPCPPS